MIGKKILHYKILEKLGEGGMGVVYKAEDAKLKREVAIKFLPRQIVANDEERERFKIEAQATAALNHPNIATIHAIEEVDDEMFIVMEYIKGQELKRKIDASALKVTEILNIAMQIAEGLQAAHKKGIIHRDIKSANIMLTENDHVKIMDFGLAKLVGHFGVTKDSTTLGTVAYMAPEQAQSDEIDHRTDIWSFGIVLYEMLTGKCPFKAAYEQAVIYCILNEETPNLSENRQDIPFELSDLLYKTLQKEPDNRFQQMSDILSCFKKLQTKLDSKRIHPTDSPESVPSIAVMPFVDMSSAKDQEYFCDGIAEELINALTKIQKLHVVARTSAFAFKGQNKDIREIGRTLDVENLLEGSVRTAGNRLRVTAQLIKVSSGYHLWSEKYDRNMQDIFDIQDDISMAIVENLKIKLLDKEKSAVIKRQTENIDAYQECLKGWYFLSKATPRDINKAFEYFQNTLKEDPNYASAYAGQARGYILSSIWGNIHPDDVYPQAKTCVEQALQLDKTQGVAYAISGFIQAIHDWDWSAAERSFQKALNYQPNSAVVHLLYSFMLSHQSRYSEAIVAAKEAFKLDLLSPYYATSYALILRHAHCFDEAIVELKKIIEIYPEYWYAHWHLGCAFWEKSMFEESLRELEIAYDLSGHMSMATSHFIAYLYRDGNWEAADKMLPGFIKRSKTEYIPPVMFFLIYWGRNELDVAFQWLNKAYENRDSLITFYLTPHSPYDQEIIDDPRFQNILQKVGVKR